MKKTRSFALLAVLGMAAGTLAFTKAKAEEAPTTHSCVLVASSPTNGTISCIGDGKACTVVGDCIKS